jgi:hypothetical protein
VHGGVSDGKGVDEFRGGVHLDMVFVAVIRDAAFLRPAGVEVLLAGAARLLGNALRHLPALDLLVLVTAVALFRRLDEAGVDDLAATGNQPSLA